jgi:radical SAM superfamily enzyme YgiQ (UPF0313 family)
MKILLAYQSGLPHRKDPYISLVPTGLCYLHACLQEAGYDSILANFSAWPTSRITKELLSFKPDVIGISQWTHNRHISMELARICRAIFPHCLIVMGGGHATFCYEDILFEGSPVDIVIRGEAEFTLLELMSRLSAGTSWLRLPGLAYRHNSSITLTHHRNNIDDLDTLPLPSKYLTRSVGLDIELQVEFIVTTRGCPSTCYFCSSPDFWGRKVRFRSPTAIVEEILFVRNRYGLIYFSMRDDTFTADRKRVIDFCSLLQRQEVNILWNCQSRVTAIDEELVIQMKRAGCECIQLGIESGSPRILEKLGKTITPNQIEQACAIIRKVGINLSVYLISDVPGETDNDLQLTLNLVSKLQPDDGYVSPLAYYPGARLFKDAVASGATSSDLFTKKQQIALYAASAPGESNARLLKELTKNIQDDPERFNRQKELLGYCTVTNVIAGEWYRQQGEYDKAEKELQEITTRQPGNPWGWFLLGDLFCECGRTKKAQEYYAMVLNLVPDHRPSKAAQLRKRAKKTKV